MAKRQACYTVKPYECGPARKLCYGIRDGRWVIVSNKDAAPGAKIHRAKKRKGKRK